MSDHEEQKQNFIKLNGSIGHGDNALLTVVTRDEATGGDREETFQTPAAFIDWETLTKYFQYKIIIGFKIMRQMKDTTEEVL